MKKLSMLVAVILMSGLMAFAASNTGTSTVQLTVSPEASISVSNATLTTGATDFSSPFTGSSTLTYSVRTTKVGGNGSIVVEVTNDFNAGGPLAASGNLTYTCTATGPATAGGCGTAAATASTTATTPVFTFGADAHANALNTSTVTWSVPDNPSYQTGTYTATVTWTITAL